jgi:hypothetical protein
MEASCISINFKIRTKGNSTNLLLVFIESLNPYSVAPWVIGVAAGTKDGKLADFSSRGIEGDPLYHPTITAELMSRI